MAEPVHPAAIHHLPPFVTAPGDTDSHQPTRILNEIVRA